jgi:hypothetical protein
VRPGTELRFELATRESQGFQRFERPALFWTERVHARVRALAFEILHAFLNPRLRINQPFASITHLDDLPLTEVNSSQLTVKVDSSPATTRHHTGRDCRLLTVNCELTRIQHYKMIE